MTLLLCGLAILYAVILIKNPLEYEKLSYPSSESDENSTWTSSNCTTDYSDGNFELSDYNAVYGFSKKSVYLPYQQETFLSNIRTNSTIHRPQSLGFQFGVRFNNSLKDDPTKVFFEFNLVNKFENGTITRTVIPKEQCTTAHFSVGLIYSSEKVISQLSVDPLQGINISSYTCPAVSTISFYSNSDGAVSQYVEIHHKLWDNITTSNSCANVTIVGNEYHFD